MQLSGCGQVLILTARGASVRIVLLLLLLLIVAILLLLRHVVVMMVYSITERRKLMVRVVVMVVVPVVGSHGGRRRSSRRVERVELRRKVHRNRHRNRDEGEDRNCSAIRTAVAMVRHGADEHTTKHSISLLPDNHRNNKKGKRAKTGPSYGVEIDRPDVVDDDDGGAPFFPHFLNPFKVFSKTHI